MEMHGFDDPKILEVLRKLKRQLLSRKSPLQQLVVHAQGGTAPSLGVPGALGEQAHRCARSGGAGACANQPTERARLADVAGLSVAQSEGQPH